MHLSPLTPVYRSPFASREERRSRPIWDAVIKGPGAARSGVLIVAVVLALGACTANDTPSGAAQPAPSTPPASQDTAGEDTRTPPKKVSMADKPTSDKPARNGQNPATGHSISPELMTRLVAFVASEAGVTADEVVLERAEDKTWNDGSMGCPQPNMAYMQALVEGHWAVFHVGPEEFDLRISRRGSFMRCKGSTKQPPIRYEDS